MKKRALPVLLCLLTVILCSCSKLGMPREYTVRTLFRMASTNLVNISQSSTYRLCAFDLSYVYNKDGEMITVDGRQFFDINLNYGAIVDIYSVIFTDDFLSEFLNEYYYDYGGRAFVLFSTEMGGWKSDIDTVEYSGEKDGGYLYTVVFNVDGTSYTADMLIKNTEDGYRVSDFDYPLSEIAQAKSATMGWGG